jgi:hypothetical protein
MSEFGQNPPAQELQFQHAEPLTIDNTQSGIGQRCVACKQPIASTYYHAQGQVVCPFCAERIQSGQQAAPPLSLARGVLYGLGAALGGSILYATVSIVTGIQIGLMAIVVGFMVGKAIRHASNGLGGRAQQILAIVLTYFAITTSYIPVVVYHNLKNPKQLAQSQGQNRGTVSTPNTGAKAGAGASFGRLFLLLLMLAAIAPFLMLKSGASGLISLFIIFIGLKRAWALTGKSEILVMGPYEPAATS